MIYVLIGVISLLVILLIVLMIIKKKKGSGKPTNVAPQTINNQKKDIEVLDI